MVMPEFDAELHDRTTREIGYNEGYDEGKAAGIAEGKAGTVCNMLSDVCRLPEAWRKRILAERNIDTLDTWIQIAHRVESLDEFLAKAGLGT